MEKIICRINKNHVSEVTGYHLLFSLATGCLKPPALLIVFYPETCEIIQSGEICEPWNLRSAK